MDYGASVLHNITLDESTSSSDAADVLIRSTKVSLEENKQKGEGEGELSEFAGSCSVNLYVQRLSGPGHGCCYIETAKPGLMEREVPPALLANMPSSLNRGMY